MGEVAGHFCVPMEVQHVADADSPIPVGCDKTVSQPCVVALMTDLLGIEEGDKLLEIGTGFGYHSAILALMAGEVFTVEIHAELAREGEPRPVALGRDTTNCQVGDTAPRRPWPAAGRSASGGSRNAATSTKPNSRGFAPTATPTSQAGTAGTTTTDSQLTSAEGSSPSGSTAHPAMRRAS